MADNIFSLGSYTPEEHVNDISKPIDIDSIRSSAELSETTKNNIDKLLAISRANREKTTNAISQGFSRPVLPVKSSKIIEADNNYKKNLKNLSDSFKGISDDNSEESAARLKIDSIRKQVADDYSKYGSRLKLLANSDLLANDEIALKYRNDPLYKDIYDRATQDELNKQRSTNQSTFVKPFDPIASNKLSNQSFLGSLKDYANSFIKGTVNAAVDTANFIPNAINTAEQYQAISNGSFDKRLDIEWKKKQVNELKQLAEQAKASGNIEAAAEYAKAANAPELQESYADRQFLNSKENKDLDQLIQANNVYQKDKAAINNGFGENANQKRLDWLLQNGSKDYYVSDLGTRMANSFLNSVGIRAENLSGLANEIVGSLPVMLMSTNIGGMITSIGGQASDMINRAWQENMSNPDPSRRMSEENFIKLVAASTTAATFNLMGDRLIAKGIKPVYRDGITGLSRAEQRGILADIESKVDAMGIADPQVRVNIIANMYAARIGTKAAEYEQLLKSKSIQDFNKSIAEDNANINPNILRDVAGDAIAVGGSTFKGLKKTSTWLANKANNAMTALGLANTLPGGLIRHFANTTQQTARLAGDTIKNVATVAPKQGALGTIGSLVKNQGTGSLGLGFDNAMNEYFTGEAEYYGANQDKSRRKSAEDIASAFGSGLVQAPMMSAHSMAGAYAGHIVKSIKEKTTDSTSEKNFTNTFNAIKSQTEDEVLSSDSLKSIKAYQDKHTQKINDIKKKIQDLNSDLTQSIGNVENGFVKLDGFNDINVINTDKTAISKLDTIEQQKVLKAAAQQQQLITELQRLQKQSNQLDTLKEKVMDQATKSLINGVSDKNTNVDVIGNHINNIVNEYSATDDNAAKSAIMDSFVKNYANNLMQSKNVSKEDANDIAKQEFDKFTKLDRYISNEIGKELNSKDNYETAVGKSLLNTVNTAADHYYDTIEVSKGAKDSFIKLTLSKVLSALKSNGISNDTITRLNKYDNAGDLLKEAYVQRILGNSQKADDAFNQFSTAMKKNQKDYELEYQTNVFNNLSEENFNKYESYRDLAIKAGQWAGTALKKGADFATQTFKGSTVSEDTAKEKLDQNTNADFTKSAVERSIGMRSGTNALRSAIKSLNTDAKLLDTSEYVDLIKKAKSQGYNSLSDQEKINLWTNAVARREKTGLEIYKEGTNKSETEVVSNFISEASKLETQMDAAEKSETVIIQLTNGRIPSISATGSEGKAKLEQAIKDSRISGAFTVMDVTPEESDASKKSYLIAATNYVALAPFLAFQQASVDWMRTANASFKSAPILNGYKKVIDYYLKYKDQLEKTYTFSNKENDFDYVVHHILVNGPFAPQFNTGIDKLSTTDQINAIQTAIDATLNNTVSNLTNQASQIISQKGITDLTKYLQQAKPNTIDPRIIAGEIAFSLDNNKQYDDIYKIFVEQMNGIVNTYLSGLNNLMDALALGKARYEAVNSTNVKHKVLSVINATKVTTRRRVNVMLGNLHHYQQIKHTIELKERIRKAKLLAEEAAKQNDNAANQTGSDEDRLINQIEKFSTLNDDQKKETIAQAKHVVDDSIFRAVKVVQAITQFGNVRGKKIDSILSNLPISKEDLELLRTIYRKLSYTISLNQTRVNITEINDYIKENINSLNTAKDIIGGLVSYYDVNPTKLSNEKGSKFSSIALSKSNDNNIEVYTQTGESEKSKSIDAFQVLSDYFTGSAKVRLGINGKSANLSQIVTVLKEYSKQNPVVDNNVQTNDRVGLTTNSVVDAIGIEVENNRSIYESYRTQLDELITDLCASSAADTILRRIFDDCKNLSKYGVNGFKDFDEFKNVLQNNTKHKTFNREDFIINNLRSILSAVNNIQDDATKQAVLDNISNKLLGVASFKDLTDQVKKNDLKSFNGHFDLLNVFIQCFNVLSIAKNDSNRKIHGALTRFIAIVTRLTNKFHSELNACTHIKNRIDTNYSNFNDSNEAKSDFEKVLNDIDNDISLYEQTTDKDTFLSNYFTNKTKKNIPDKEKTKYLNKLRDIFNVRVVEKTSLLSSINETVYKNKNREDRLNDLDSYLPNNSSSSIKTYALHKVAQERLQKAIDTISNDIEQNNTFNRSETDKNLTSTEDTINTIEPQNYLNEVSRIETLNETSKTPNEIIQRLKDIAQSWKALREIESNSNDKAQYDKYLKDIIIEIKNVLGNDFPINVEDLFNNPETFTLNTKDYSDEKIHKFAEAVFNKINTHNLKITSSNQIKNKFCINTKRMEVVSTKGKARDTNACVNWDNQIRGLDSLNWNMSDIDNNQLVIDINKLNNLFAHCNTIQDVIDALEATNTSWASDFANVVRIVAPLTEKMNNLSSSEYINSRYGATDIFDKLSKTAANGNKYGNSNINLAATIAMAMAIYRGGKLEMTQNQDKIDSIPGISETAKQKLSTLKGANRDDIITNVINDLRRLLPFKNNQYKEALIQGAAVRAFQAFESAGLIQQQFMDLKTGIVHTSSTDASNKGCICIVTYNSSDQSTYTANKQAFDIVDKLNHRDHVDIYQKLFGVKSFDNLEPENESEHKKHINEYDNNAYITLRDLANTLGDDGHYVDDADTSTFNSFLKKNTGNSDYMYVLNCILNKIRGTGTTGGNSIIKALDELKQGKASKSTIDYFNRNNQFKFDQNKFNDCLSRIPYIAVGLTMESNASIAIVNMDYQDPLSKAIATGKPNLDKGFVLLDGEQIYSDPQAGTFCPTINILSTATLDNTPVAFDIGSGILLLNNLVQAGISLDSIMNNDIDFVLQQILTAKPILTEDDINKYIKQHFNDNKYKTLKGDDATKRLYIKNNVIEQNKRLFALKTQIGIEDVRGVGMVADSKYSDDRSKLNDVFIQMKTLLGIDIFQNKNNNIKLDNIHSLYDYLIDKDNSENLFGKRKTPAGRLQDLYENHYKTLDSENEFDDVKNQKDLKVKSWHVMYFYHRTTPNNRIYTCGTLITNREQKGNRCVFKCLLREGNSYYKDPKATSLRFAASVSGSDEFHDLFINEGKVYGFMTVFSAQLGLSPDKLYRMNYWRNLDTDGNDWSLAGRLIELLDSKEFNDFIKYAADHDYQIEFNTDGSAKIDNFLESLKVATVDASQIDLSKNQSIPSKKFGFLGGDWTSNSNSYPILRDLVQMYRADNEVFHNFAKVLKIYRDKVTSKPNVKNNVRTVLTNDDMDDIRNQINQISFDNVHMRFVHEGDGLTSGPGISNGLFDYLTAYEMIETTDASDPRYKIFNMTGTFMRRDFDEQRSIVTINNLNGNPDFNLDLYLSLGDLGTYQFHSYFRAAMQNFGNNITDINARRFFDLLSIFGDKSANMDDDKMYALGKLADIVYSRDNSKHLMTPYNYGAGMRALSLKVVEVAFDLWNDNIQNSTNYELDTFLKQGTELSSNGTFTFDIAAYPDNNEVYVKDVNTVTYNANTNTYEMKTYDGTTITNQDHIKSLVEKAWNKKKVSIDFRKQEGNGINEFIRGSVGKAMATAADQVMGKAREQSKYISICSGLLTAMAESTMVLAIREVIKGKKWTKDNKLEQFTVEDINQIKQKINTMLDMSFSKEGNANLAAGVLKSRLQAKIIPAIQQITQDLCADTYYPVPEEETGTKGLSVPNDTSKVINSGTSRSSPLYNHTLDARIANYTHRYASTAFIDVFDAMITDANNFIDVMRLSNESHMEVMFTQNGMIPLAENLTNALAAFKVEVWNTINGKDEFSKQDKEAVLQTFRDYGISNIEDTSSIDNYRKDLVIAGLQYDLNRVKIIDDILAGVNQNVYFNGYNGAAESTINLKDSKTRAKLAKIRQLLLKRNGIEEISKGVYVLANDNKNITKCTGLNYRIFCKLQESSDPYASQILSLLTTVKSTNNNTVVASYAAKELGLFDSGSTVQKFIDIVNLDSTLSDETKKHIADLIKDIATNVRSANDLFTQKWCDALTSVSKVTSDSTKTNAYLTAIHDGNQDAATNAIRNEYYKKLAESFNNWDTATKDNGTLFNAVYGLCQEAFNIHLINGADLYNLAGKVFLKLADKNISSLTKADIIVALFNEVQPNQAGFDTAKKLLLKASDISINSDYDTSTKEVLNKIQNSNTPVYLHKSTDLPFSVVDGLLKVSTNKFQNRDANGIITKYIDDPLKRIYSNNTNDSIIIVEGHNLTDFIIYQRLLQLQKSGDIKAKQIVYAPEAPVSHSETKSLRTLDTILANKLRDAKNVSVKITAYLGDSVDSDLNDSISFWGNPSILSDSTYNTESFAIPTKDATGHILEIARNDRYKSGSELKRTISSRDHIKSGDITHINLTTQFSTIGSNVNTNNLDIDTYFTRSFSNVSNTGKDLNDSKYNQIPDKIWLQSTVKDDFNNGFNTHSVNLLLNNGVSINHTVNNPKDETMLSFGNWLDRNDCNRSTIIIPIIKSIDGRVTLPKGEYFNAQFLDSVDSNILHELEGIYKSREETESKNDPIVTKTINFKNANGQGRAKIVFMNVNSTYVSRNELLQYIVKDEITGKYEWNIDKLKSKYGYIDNLPSIDDVRKGLNSVDTSGLHNPTADTNGFYPITAIEKGKSIFTNKAVGYSNSNSYTLAQYLEAHLRAEYSGDITDSESINLLSGVLGDIVTSTDANITSKDFYKSITQFTGKMSKEEASKYNTRHIESDLAGKYYRESMRNAEELAGVRSKPTRSYSGFTQNGIVSESEEADRLFESALNEAAKDGNEMYQMILEDMQWDINQGNVSSDDIAYLKDVAAELMSTGMKMHFLFDSRLDAIKGNMSGIDFNNPENMERAVVVMASKTAMSKRPGLCRSEILVHEIAHNLFKLMTPHQLDEATRLWQIASKVLTVDDLVKAGAPQKDAEIIYDYLFKDKTSDGVQEFLAYVLTNRYVIKALNSDSVNRQINNEYKKAVNSRITGFIRKVFNLFTNFSFSKNLATTKVREFFNSSVAISRDMDEARKNFLRYAGDTTIKRDYAEAVNKDLVEFKTSLLSKFDRQIPGLPSYEEFTNKIIGTFSNKKDKFLNSLIEQSQGVTKDNLQYVLCGYKYRSQLDSAKGVAIGSMNDLVKNLLEEYGITDIDSQIKQNLSTVILRYDLGSLDQLYEGDQIIKFLDPSNKDRSKELLKLSQEINDSWIINRANDLAEYMRTGSNPNGFRYVNAYQIAAKLGTKNKNMSIQPSDDLVHKIDSYITLKALDDSIKSKNNPITDKDTGVFSLLSKTNKTTQDDGSVLIKKLAGLQKSLKISEANNVWGNEDNAARNIPKSYIFPSCDSDKKVRLVAYEDMARWTAIGYNQIPNTNVQVIDGHKMVWMGSIHHAYAPDTNGLFSKAARNFIHGKDNQLNIYGEDFMYGRLSINDQTEMFQKVVNQIQNNNGIFKIGDNSITNLVPRFNAAGDIAAIDVELNEQSKESFLQQGNYLDINKAMGNLAGMISERAITPNMNNACAKSLIQYYKDNKGTKKFKFIKDENDPLYRYLPDTIKQLVAIDPELKDKGFPVETKYVDYVFGKERFSLANWVEKKLIQSAGESFFFDMLTNTLSLRFGISLEHFAQKCAEFGKNMIVVKMLKPSIINTASNITVLHALGDVPIKEAVSSMKTGYEALKSYRYWLREKAITEYQLNALDAKDPNYLNNKNKLEKYIQQINTAMQANPASDLFNAGLYNATAMFTTNYQEPLAIQMAKALNIKPLMKAVNDPRIKEIFSVKGSTLYELSMDIATSNDFAARYALYKHMLDEAHKLGKEFNINEFIKKADDMFINYNIPEPGLIDYLDRMGIFCFSRYFIGIQKAIYEGIRKHPLSMLGTLGLSAGLAAATGAHVPTILESILSYDNLANRIKLPGTEAIDNLDGIPTYSIASLAL